MITNPTQSKTVSYVCKMDIYEKNVSLFLPDSEIIGQLVHRQIIVEIFCPFAVIIMSTSQFDNLTLLALSVKVFKVFVSMRWKCFVENPFGA